MDIQEQLNIVITGHVDHGKSTVIGRLMADTNSLPQGKLESVKAFCEKNAKVFEYAFLLDALKEEQAQGITIDAARIFFRTKKRNYLIIDAPGHIEFLKNMISGAARAEGGIIVIDAKEGIRENSRRHGYLISMLGIRQVTVLVNKMDAVGYDQGVFDSIAAEYLAFLDKIGVKPLRIIPIAARNGENLTERSAHMAWYDGPTLLEQIDRYEADSGKDGRPFRFPVQDVYKFTGDDDDRRILAGMVVSGRIRVGDAVRFYPSNNTSRIRSIELFNGRDIREIGTGYSAGFTLEDALYIRPGDVMVRADENNTPRVSRRFLANLFWMSNVPMVKGRSYVVKLGSAKVSVRLVAIRKIVDATELTSVATGEKIERYDVAECVFEANKPVAFDLVPEYEYTARFVVIDNYEISGAGIILAAEDDGMPAFAGEIARREALWDRGEISSGLRAERNRHRGGFVLVAGDDSGTVAKNLEKVLFRNGYQAYYLGTQSIRAGLERERSGTPDRDEDIRRLGELAKLFSDAGMIFVSALTGVDAYDLERLKALNDPNGMIVVNAGEPGLGAYPADLSVGEGSSADMRGIVNLLREREVLLEYYL